MPACDPRTTGRLSFLDRYLTLRISLAMLVEVPVMIGLVNVALSLQGRYFEPVGMPPMSEPTVAGRGAKS